MSTRNIRPEQARLPLLLWCVACLVIIIAIAGGLASTGGPWHQRAERMDSRRVNDLYQLSNEIANYERLEGRLPETLAALQAENRSRDLPTQDPVSGHSYEYQRLSHDRYQLCAVFETDNRQDARRHDGYAPDNDGMNKHPKGLDCVTRRKKKTPPGTKLSRPFTWVSE